MMPFPVLRRSAIRVAAIGVTASALAAGDYAERPWPLPVLPQAATTFAALDSLIMEELAATGTPGASIAIVVGDSIVYARGYGVANVETREPVVGNTLFRIASTTKMLTAAAVILEARRIGLDLDAEIGRYATDLPRPFRAITLRQLLTHTGGLVDGASYFGPHDDNALARAIRTWPATNRFAPAGDVFSYSNIGYGLAAYVVERASRQFYADVMQRAVFAPLDMTRSTVRPLEAMTRPFAQGHDRESHGLPAVVRPFADDARYWPNGGVFTTAPEFAHFVLALLNHGKLRAQQVIPPDIVDELLHGFVDVPGSRIGEHAQYALGLNVKTLRGTRMWQHGGERIGFGSVVRFVPAGRFGIVILTNRTGSFLPRTLEAATSLAVPIDGGSLPSSDMTFRSLEPEAGHYVNLPDSLEFDVVLEQGKFMVRRADVTTGIALEHAPDGRYLASGQPFVFVRGKVTGQMYLHVAGRSLRRTKP